MLVIGRPVGTWYTYRDRLRNSGEPWPSNGGGGGGGVFIDGIDEGGGGGGGGGSGGVTLTDVILSDAASEAFLLNDIGC